MISRNAKLLFYLVLGPVMYLNGKLYKNFRAPKYGENKVHLGPGRNKYIPGWINVDANIFTGKCDVWADLRNPLPFHDNSISCFYSHHMVEHLPDLEAHFKEVCRCLKSGGVYRIGGPNGDSAIQKFVSNEAEWFDDFPVNRKSIGGRFENFIFCRGEHLTILTASYLEELLESIGFDVKFALPVKETNFPEYFRECFQYEFESDYSCPHTLIIEAVKK